MAIAGGVSIDIPQRAGQVDPGRRDLFLQMDIVEASTRSLRELWAEAESQL